jgi:RNA polymerase sigma factor (sigma-70 family)
MNVHISYKAGKTSTIEHEFQHQLLKLQRRLQVFKPDLVHFHAIVTQENGHSASVSLNLRLPSGQMAVQKSAESILAAIKGAFVDLMSQVTKHKELLRGQWNWKGRHGSGRKQTVVPAVPLEQAFVAVPYGSQMSDRVINGWINANLQRLQAFVERELRYRVVIGQLRPDQITREEVIDEVIVSALSPDEAKPETLSLESWFNRLALRAFRALIESSKDTASVSLDAPAGKQNVTGSDENVLQYHQPDDSLREESIIADENVRTPEEIFASEEMVSQLDLVLHEVRPEDREAFVLYTLEGFTVDEIARISDQPPEHIRKCIHQAREKIQQRLPAHNEFKRSLLRGSRVA